MPAMPINEVDAHLLTFKRGRILRRLIGVRKWETAMECAATTLETGHHVLFRRRWKNSMKDAGLDPVTIWILFQIASLIIKWWLERRSS